MSYTPDEQQLTPHCDKIIDGCEGLLEAMNERINNPSEWDSDHRADLHSLYHAVFDFEKKIRAVREGNR